MNTTSAYQVVECGTGGVRIVMARTPQEAVEKLTGTNLVHGIDGGGPSCGRFVVDFAGRFDVYRAGVPLAVASVPAGQLLGTDRVG